MKTIIIIIIMHAHQSTNQKEKGSRDIIITHIYRGRKRGLSSFVANVGFYFSVQKILYGFAL